MGSAYLFAFACCLHYGLVTFFLARNFKKVKRNTRYADSNWTLNELTVIIPFRNEEQRILPLLESLNAIQNVPRILFIDDFSEDSTMRVLHEKVKFNYEVFQSHEAGKKAAIQTGVENTSTVYILTLDADVELASNYFETLCSIELSDVNILPIETKSTKWIEAFFRWEYQLQRVSWASFGYCTKPITGSGANLLFKRRVFQNVNTTRTDMHLASGDDHFLIQEANRHGYKVMLNENEDLCVKTAAPRSFWEGLSQRKRWLSKTQEQVDWAANLFGIWLLLAQVSMYVGIVVLYNFDIYWLALGLLLLKADFDGWICTYHFMRGESTFKVWTFELFYPIYLISLIVVVLFAKVRWKGREIKKPR